MFQSAIAFSPAAVICIRTFFTCRPPMVTLLTSRFANPPEQQIGDLVELNAMRQYHSQGKGHKQAVRTAGWLGVTK
jgi:hypothetical protein